MKEYLFSIALIFLVACAPAQPETVLNQAPVDAEMQKEMTETMEPGLIGGTVSKYYDWDKAKFDQAVADGKTILIDFAANWCGICQKEELHYKAAFAELNDPNIIGFKVHYKDDQTTPEHEALAQQYQIAYQHTKVVLKNGQVVKKSPEAWEKDRIIKELTSV
jgi:thiol-disulfide isomerase/thioredoxin